VKQIVSVAAREAKSGYYSEMRAFARTESERVSCFDVPLRFHAHDPGFEVGVPRRWLHDHVKVHLQFRNNLSESLLLKAKNLDQIEQRHVV